MAEGLTSSPLQKYFCYQCDQEVSISRVGPIQCPECSTGFLEEVSAEDEFDDDSDVDESELNLLRLLSIENLFRRTLMTSIGEDPDPDSSRRTSSESNEEGDEPEPAQDTDIFSPRAILQDLEDNFVRGHTGLRHIGDYLFGEDIDALSTMLLNETEIVGPPPLPKDQIKLLPVISVSKDDVDKEVQCTICMEDFIVREKAKLLHCQHFYHEKCITPWLERHATCPNCRKPVEVQSKNRRSQSCPRAEYNLRNTDRRRASESTSVSGFFSTSMSPFRFL